jgi:ABC-type transport system substrate-binding protein
MTLLNVSQLKAALKQHKGAFRILNGATFNPEELFMNVHNSPDGGKTVTVKDNSGNVVYNGKNPISNVKVRQALSLAFSRVGLIKYMYKVPTSIANKVFTYANPVPNEKALSDPYANKSITGAWNGHKWETPGTKAAISDAIKLLKSAGYKGCSASHTCVTVYLTTNGTGNVARGNAVAYLQRAWRAIGVNTNYVDVESGSHGPFLRTYSAGGTAANGWYEIALFAYGLGIPQPDGFLPNLTTQYCPQIGKSDVDGNYACVEDKTINKDFNGALRTTNDKKRKQLFDQMQSEVVKNAYWVATDVRPNIETYDKKAGGIVNSPFSLSTSNWDAWDWKAM